MSTTLPRLPDFAKYLPELRLSDLYTWHLSRAGCDMMMQEGEWFEIVQKVMNMYFCQLNGRVYDDRHIVVDLIENEDEDDEG